MGAHPARPGQGADVGRPVAGGRDGHQAEPLGLDQGRDQDDQEDQQGAALEAGEEHEGAGAGRAPEPRRADALLAPRGSARIRIQLYLGRAHHNTVVFRVRAS